MKNHSCSDLTEPQSEDRRSALDHGVIEMDATVASFQLLPLSGLPHCEPEEMFQKKKI